jgi:ribonuclease HI
MLYTDGFKISDEVLVGYCQVSVKGKHMQVTNISLEGKLEIMDAELAPLSQALPELHNQGLQGEEIHIFVDSQAALKRLRKISLTRGQKISHE